MFLASLLLHIDAEKAARLTPATAKECFPCPKWKVKVEGVEGRVEGGGR
jgi:hypothetical protein